MEDKYIVAIEIGSSKIRGALASVNPNSTVNIIAVQEERLTDSVRHGQVRNIDETATAISEICRMLQNSKAIATRKIKSVYVGIGALTVGSESTTATREFPADTPITAEIVDELKDSVASVSGSKTIFHIVPVKYTVDNEDTMKPIGRFAHSIKGTFQLITGNTGLRSNIERAVKDRCGFSVSDYIVTTLAEADAVLTPDERQLGCMLVDFGAETTSIAIYKANSLRSLVTLPMGSRNITRDLMALNNTEEQAEAIKRSTGIQNVATDSPQFGHEVASAEAANYISARAAEIVANIIARIESAGLKPTDLPKGIILIGGGAQLKGFQTLLADQSKLPVRLGSIPREVRVLDTTARSDEAIDVISLLMVASKMAGVEASVTPLQPERPTPQQIKIEDDEEDESASRIGHLYDDNKPVEDDDDDYDMDDAFEDDEDNDKGAQKKSDKKTSGGFRSIVESIKRRITDLTQDNIEDAFEDDDNE